MQRIIERDKKAGPQPGDIRYDIPAMLNLPLRQTENVIHASDNKPGSAERKIEIFDNLLYTNQKV